MAFKIPSVITRICICIYINCAWETRRGTSHHNKLQHRLWLSHQAQLHITNVTLQRESSLTITSPSCTYFSTETGNRLLKNYCRKENCFIYLSGTTSTGHPFRERSFLFGTTLDINFCVRIFFSIHPWPRAMISPEVKPGCMMPVKGSLQLTIASHRYIFPASPEEAAVPSNWTYS